MATYEYCCEADHWIEIRCGMDERPETVECPECGKPARQGFLTAPMLNNPNVCVLDYPGSKRSKAGYVHSHGNRPATKTSSGYGGVVNAQRDNPAAEFVKQNFQFDSKPSPTDPSE